MIRIRLIETQQTDAEALAIASMNEPLLVIWHQGQRRWGVLEETFGEGSAEGESWKPVEIY